MYQPNLLQWKVHYCTTYNGKLLKHHHHVIIINDYKLFNRIQNLNYLTHIYKLTHIKIQNLLLYVPSRNLSEYLSKHLDINQLHINTKLRLLLQFCHILRHPVYHKNKVDDSLFSSPTTLAVFLLVILLSHWLKQGQ